MIGAMVRLSTQPARSAVEVSRWGCEAAPLLATRLTLGDERTAELIFEQDYDAGFTGRHTHQLAGLLEAAMDAKALDNEINQ